MIVKVNFIDERDSHGTACLVENLITNEINLDLNPRVVINEVEHFINKTIEILKPRYGEDIDVDINWKSLKEDDVDVVTSK